MKTITFIANSNSHITKTFESKAFDWARVNLLKKNVAFRQVLVKHSQNNEKS